MKFRVPSKWVDEAKIRSTEGGLNRRSMAGDNPDAQIAGHLGEFSFAKAMNNCGIRFRHIDVTETYDYDFLVGSKRIDVKTKVRGNNGRSVPCKQDYTCDVPEYQANVCDSYVFASWDKEGEEIYLMSGCKQERFKAKAELKKAGVRFEGRLLQSDLLVARYCDFTEFDEYIDLLHLYSTRAGIA